MKKAVGKTKKRVFVGMSGGVDSSVAALLLKRQGYEVIGVFMRSYNIDGCAERDAEDARRVAEKIGIPFYVWDFEEEYKKRVVEYMVNGYKKGLTPNPDVMCNREIKFGLFLERALKMGADYVATGHYVRLEDGKLKIAKDLNKDQSYFLWTLTEKQLKYCLFPVGGLLKPKLRDIAKKAGLPTASKKDSQGICFLGMVSMSDFLKKYIPERTGDVLLAKANGGLEKIGEHNGAHFYTIGQRQGIGNIKHQKGNQTHIPVYVIEKDVKKNLIIVAEGSENPLLSKKEVELIDINLAEVRENKRIAKERIPVFARVRYRQPLFEATLEIKKNGKGKLIFKQPQKFVAEGQSAVLYVEDHFTSRGRDPKGFRMLGGGIITN